MRWMGRSAWRSWSALARGTPEVFETDQGAQFTSLAFTGRLEQAGVQISADGSGRALDNVFVERLWRTVKYEDVYLKGVRAAVRPGDGLAGVLPLLQRGAAAPGVGVSAADGGVSGGGVTGADRRHAPRWLRAPWTLVQGAALHQALEMTDIRRPGST